MPSVFMFRYDTCEHHALHIGTVNKAVYSHSIQVVANIASNYVRDDCLHDDRLLISRMLIVVG